MKSVKHLQIGIQERRAGFTLVELLVAMGVFLAAVTLAVGVFVQALKAQRFINNLMSVQSNASIALESMAREIRTGDSFNVDNLRPTALCSGNQNDILHFTSASGKLITYELNGQTLMRQACNVSQSQGGCKQSDVFQPLTASNVAVNRLCFTMNSSVTQNSPAARVDPWRITIFLNVGAVSSDFAASSLNLETTVSSRVLPCESSSQSQACLN